MRIPSASVRPSFPIVPTLMLIGMLWLLVGTAPDVVQAQPVQLPSERASGTLSQAAPSTRLGPVDTEGLLAEDAERASSITPYRYGVVRQVDLHSQDDGRWTTRPDGSRVWRIQIDADGAVNLSPVFEDLQLPPGSRLFVHDGDRTSPQVRGPYTTADVTRGALRPPHVRGNRLVVEVDVPASFRGDAHVRIDRVIHGYREIRPPAQDGSLPRGARKAGACNLDVACSEADPWRDQVRSVGLYTFEFGGGASSCTGSLVNTTAGDKRPYFLTAEHCISTAEEASTMVFYWNYQNPTCRTPGTIENGSVTDDPLEDQTSIGAELLARFGNVSRIGSIVGRPDLSLVEIQEPLRIEYDLFFNGWSSEDVTPQEAVTIHHPVGHGKRISFDTDPLAKSAFGQPPGGSSETHLYVEAWELGTTEGGSSGSPLFDANRRVVGVLSGGAAGCVGLNANDNDEPDWYGRLAAGFTDGDFEGRTFQDVLDPAGTGAQVLNGINLRDGDDDTPPAEVTDFAATGADDAGVNLTWTASGDDGTSGTAYLYELRVARAEDLATPPLDTEAEFAQARSIQAFASPPQPSGTPEEIRLPSITPGVELYFALRVIDDGLNETPIAFNPDPVSIPDVLAPEPLLGLQATARPEAQSIDLSWIAPGDDASVEVAFGTIDPVESYDVRFASSPIETEADFAAATPLSLPLSPVSPGLEQTVTFSDPEADVPYYFGVRAVDDAGNVSPLATTPENTILLDSDVRTVPAAPHPARTQTTLRFAVQEPQTITIRLYDAMGRRVRTLFSDVVPANRERRLSVDTSTLSSGVYFVRYEGERTTEVQRLVVVR